MFKEGEKVTPVSLSGTSYKDSKLKISSNVATISPTIRSYLFEFVFHFLIWGAFLFFASIVLNEKSTEPSEFILFVTIFCVSFSAIVRLIFYRIRKVHLFDKDSGQYFEGKKINASSSKSTIKLEKIQKLHLISKQIYSSGNSYTCFELSFCTADKQRKVLMNHSEYYEIKIYAEKLAEFLCVPLENLRKGDIY